MELLEEHTRRLAAGLTVDIRGGDGRTRVRALADDVRILRAAYRALAEDARAGEPPSPAAEWLLDNYFVMATAARDVRHDLPRSFFKRLPRVAADEFAGCPRIVALAQELIRWSAGRLDADRVHRCVRAFQSITPLTMGELWAWPSALKLALVGYVRAEAEVLVASRAHRQNADRVADALRGVPVEGGSWPADAHPAFVVRLLQRSHEYEQATELRRDLENTLAARSQSIEDAIASEGRHQASAQAAMSSLIGSLRLQALASRAIALADTMRFESLYDRRRRIFSIGYRLADADGAGRLDGSFYDLLASEARLASFVAIAKGDVPQHHWFHLGRLVTNIWGHATLVSWGGTQFEYLMPALLMRNIPGTLLDQSCRASLWQQIEYGKRRRVPWGVSESAYAFTDRAGNYQYRAFARRPRERRPVHARGSLGGDGDGAPRTIGCRDGALPHD